MLRDVIARHALSHPVTFDRSVKTNLGHALETVVALELERRGAEIAYVLPEATLKWTFLPATWTSNRS